MQETEINLIIPKQNDKTLDVEISFTDKRGISDKEFRDEVVDNIYDIIFRELELTAFGIKFKDNLEIITFKMVEDDNDPTVFFFIYEQLKLLSDVERNFKFSIKGLTLDYINKYKKLKYNLLNL